MNLRQTTPIMTMLIIHRKLNRTVVKNETSHKKRRSIERRFAVWLTDTPAVPAPVSPAPFSQYAIHSDSPIVNDLP